MLKKYFNRNKRNIIYNAATLLSETKIFYFSFRVLTFGASDMTIGVWWLKVVIGVSITYLYGCWCASVIADVYDAVNLINQDWCHGKKKLMQSNDFAYIWSLLLIDISWCADVFKEVLLWQANILLVVFEET